MGNVTREYWVRELKACLWLMAVFAVLLLYGGLFSLDLLLKFTVGAMVLRLVWQQVVLFLAGPLTPIAETQDRDE